MKYLIAIALPGGIALALAWPHLCDLWQCIRYQWLSRADGHGIEEIEQHERN
jgi:hypothetical protein